MSVVNRCPHCGKVVAVNRYGEMSIHGPKQTRCPGSRDKAVDTDPEKWPSVGTSGGETGEQ